MVRPAEPAGPTGGERRAWRKGPYGRRPADQMSEAWGGCDAKSYLAPGSMLPGPCSLKFSVSNSLLAQRYLRNAEV